MAELDQGLKYVDGEIEGVVIRALKFFHDQRGWLIETFRHDELDKDRWPTMMYVSSTLPGVRGAPTSMLTRQTASRSSALRIFGSTCGIPARTARPGGIARLSPWVPPIRLRSGFLPASFMLIATWEKFPAWSSTHPIGFMRDGARKSPSMRSGTRMPIRPGSSWIDASAGGEPAEASGRKAVANRFRSHS